MNDNLEITAPAAKAFAVWALFGFSTMAEAASFATMLAGFIAAFYSMLLVTEWFWKRLWKPLFMRLEWFGYKRRIITIEQDAAIVAKEADE